MADEADRRRDSIRAILTARPVTTQSELRRRLRQQGIRASQATLSRDMAALGVRRAAGAHTSADRARYLVEGDGGALPLDPVRRLVLDVRSNGVLVVVRTKASTAPTVARALDEASLPEVLGTIAGDDTVFVAPRGARDGERVARRLRALLAVV